MIPHQPPITHTHSSRLSWTERSPCSYPNVFLCVSLQRHWSRQSRLTDAHTAQIQWLCYSVAPSTDIHISLYVNKMFAAEFLPRPRSGADLLFRGIIDWINASYKHLPWKQRHIKLKCTALMASKATHCMKGDQGHAAVQPVSPPQRQKLWLIFLQLFQPSAKKKI